MSEADAGETEASIDVASRSDVGQVRSANEDSCEAFSLNDGSHLLVLADGMGGHRGGATASSTAVTIISEMIGFEKRPSSAVDALGKAIEAANARIHEIAQADPDLEGMGTTVVTFLLDGRGRGTVAHVGDSRAYRYRQGELTPLTIDHSVVAEMQKRGLLTEQEAAVHPRRNEILRSVGVLPEVDVEVAKVEVQPGDRFLLCSDGLSGVVTDDEIAAIVQMEKPARAVDSLIRMANERGGPDNISVQILSVPADESSGDPEATAPVELSEIGIKAIEAKRRQRKRLRQIGLTLGIAGLLAAGYHAWQFWQASQIKRSSPPAAARQAAPAAPTAQENAQSPRESEPETPRRGVPR